MLLLSLLSWLRVSRGKGSEQHPVAVPSDGSLQTHPSQPIRAETLSGSHVVGCFEGDAKIEGRKISSHSIDRRGGGCFLDAGSSSTHGAALGSSRCSWCCWGCSARAGGAELLQGSWRYSTAVGISSTHSEITERCDGCRWLLDFGVVICRAEMEHRGGVPLVRGKARGRPAAVGTELCAQKGQLCPAAAGKSRSAELCSVVLQSRVLHRVLLLLGFKLRGLHCSAALSPSCSAPWLCFVQSPHGTQVVVPTVFCLLLVRSLGTAVTVPL